MIVIEPAWPAYRQCAINAGVKIRAIKTTLESNWEPTIEQINSAINSNTKMIVLNYPNNPTGKILPEKLQDEIISLFQTRYSLHKQVYTHHTVNAIEQIVIDILHEINKNTDIDLSKSYDDIISFPYKNETIQQLQSQLDFRQHFRLLVEETNTVCECPEPNSKNEKMYSLQRRNKSS